MFVTDATSLPRLMTCNGSRLMAASLPPSGGDTTSRDEGNAAHWLAQQVFNRNHTIEELIDRKAPNGVWITVEMADYVQQYLDAIDRNPRGRGNMEVETTFGSEQWRVNTRADHISFIDNLLNIDDFKYGWRTVDPERNWTLIAHAIGFCAINNISPASITFTIHQPRPYHQDGSTRGWSISYEQLTGYYAQIAATLSSLSDELNTGPQCQECHALATCPAARKAGMNAIDASEMAFDDTLSNDVLSFELDTLASAKATIERRLEAIEEMAKHRLRSGQLIDNYSLENQLTNRVWKQGLNAETLSAITGKNMAKQQPITPAQAEKLGVSEDVTKALSERRSTGFKLVRVNVSKKAERLFGKKEN